MSLFRRNKRPEGNPECAQHDPCRTLLALGERDFRKSMRLLIVRSGDGIGLDPIERPINESLTCVLCVPGGKEAGGTAVMVVPEHMSDTWDLSELDMWELALENMRRDKLNQQVFNTEHGELHSVNGMGWPGAAQALRFEEIFGKSLLYGALITFPSNNAFCAVPLQSRQAMNIVPFLMQLTRELGSDGNMPQPPGLFWLYESQLEEVNVQLEGDDARMSVSSRFHEVLTGVRG